ncbi:zinc finger protein 771-like [Pungitius pungitius]|uniref:zinc finger protein 771-like n=1 Tax=Pungitius pungitius TaxID=134920 RepID=UPI002E11916D
MSQIEMLRLLITQRLTAAAEEIFGVFGRTIADYEEKISRSELEISRQRRLLDLTRKPRVSVRTAVCEQQDWSSGLSDAEPPPIKEEQEEEELWPAQREEHNDVKFSFSPGSGAGDGRLGDEEPSSPSGLQDPGDSEPDPLPGPSVQQPLPDVQGVVPGNDVVDSYICTICGRAFAQRAHWAKHAQAHRGGGGAKADKSYTCDICGKRLTRFDGYQKHLRIHTGEKPYRCSHCGRRFSDNSNYKRHVRTHEGAETG